jgi:hypothetical protein
MPNKIKHAASVLIMPKRLDRKYIVGVYDRTYPVEIFRGNFLFMGGNLKGDYSPLSLLTREISEELGLMETLQDKTVAGTKNPHKVVELDEKNYAPRDLREKLRNEVLDSTKGYADFFTRIDKNSIGTEEDVVAVISSYIAYIDKDLFDRVENEIKKGRQIVNEGELMVVKRDELVNGKIRGAWGYATILNDITGLTVPEYPFIEVSSLGEPPKNSFAAYK